MKRQLLLMTLTCSLLGLWAVPAESQDAASANWQLTAANPSSATTTGQVTATPVQGVGGLTVRSYTTLAGPLGVNMGRWWLGGTAWPIETAYNPDRYVQFTVSPESGFSFNATSLSLAIGKEGTDNFWAAIAYDTSPSFASPTFLETQMDLVRNNAAPGYSIEQYNIDVDVEPGQTFFVRVYPFTNAGGDGRYLRLQDVWIEGTTEEGEPPPVVGDPAYGLWPLTQANPLGLVTEGSVTGSSAQGDDSGNLVLRDYDGPIGPAGVSMQRWWLDGEDWPVETSHDPARYIEFRLGPSGDFFFDVQQIGMALSSSGTNNMSAAIAYATNSSFLDPNVIFDGDIIRDIEGDGWAQYNVPVNVTVPPNGFIYVRVFPYVRSGTVGPGRTIIIQNAKIEGRTLEEEEIPPMEASVNWPLTSATTLNGFSSGQVNSSPAAGVGGLVVRSYSDTPVGPLGSNMQRWWLDNEAWPVETEYNSNRYIQFVATASTDHRFIVDEIRLAIGSTGTNNMWARIAYSTSSDFSNPVVLYDGDTTRDGYDIMTFPLDVSTTLSGSIYLRIFPYTDATGAGRYLTLQDVWIEGETDTTMPVELVAFTGVIDGRDALLRWTVASEQNNAGFSVERRVGEAFQSIGFVEGRGTVQEPGEYSFRVADLAPGRHEFRLRQVDFNGAFTYSSVVELTAEVAGEFVLAPPYPNPFNPQTTVEFAVANSQPVTVSLYDVLGRQVAQLYAGTPSANEMQTVRIDGSNLTSGMYFVRLEGESFSAVRRVTLIK